MRLILTRPYILLFILTLMILLPQNITLASQEEKLYHELLNLKEKRIAELEKRLAQAEKHIRTLETGQSAPGQQSYFQNTPSYPANSSSSSHEDELDAYPSLAYSGHTDTETEYQLNAATRTTNTHQRHTYSRSAPYQVAHNYVPPHQSILARGESSSEEQVEPHAKWAGSIETFYARPRSSDLAFAQTTDATGNTISQIHENNFKDDVGYKIGLYHRPAPNWQVGGTVAYFEADSSTSASAQRLRPLPGFGVGGNQDFSQAHVKDEFEYWNTEITATRSFPNQPFELDLYGGIQLAMIDFDRHMTYSGLGPFLKQDLTQSFKGIGPTLGMKGRYDLGSYFQVDLGMGASAPYGQHETNLTSSASNFTAAVSTSPINRKDLTVVPNFKGDIGLSWHNLSPTGPDYSLRLSYFVEHWLGLNRPFTSGQQTGSSNQGVGGSTQKDITLDGLKLELKAFW